MSARPTNATQLSTQMLYSLKQASVPIVRHGHHIRPITTSLSGLLEDRTTNDSSGTRSVASIKGCGRTAPGDSLQEGGTRPKIIFYGCF